MVKSRGECAFCGDPDANHRIYDAIAERWRTGESVTALIADYSEAEVIEAFRRNIFPKEPDNTPSAQ